MNTKKQDNKKRYIEPRPEIPHEAFIFDYKQLLKKIKFLRKKVGTKDEASIKNNDLVGAVGMAMQVRKELKELCDKFLSDHPDEDNEILAHLIHLDSFYERFAGAQHTVRELTTEKAELKNRIKDLEKELSELKNAGHQEPPVS